MRLFLLGELRGHLDAVIDAYDEVIATRVSALEEVSDFVSPLGLLTDAAPADADEELLDSLSWIRIVEDPDWVAVQEATTDDVVLMAWDDSDDQHRLLKALSDKGVGVYDAADELIELVYDATPDLQSLVRTITAKVTEDVLRTLRAELDLPRPRRTRQKARTV